MTGWAAIAKAGQTARARHAQAIAAPRKAQDATLAKILRALNGSAFANDHDLRPEMDRAAFWNAVPVRDYEAFRPWLNALITGAPRALTHTPPVAFELTGGSSGGRKPVPLAPALLGGFETASPRAAPNSRSAPPCAKRRRLSPDCPSAGPMTWPISAPSPPRLPRCC